MHTEASSGSDSRLLVGKCECGTVRYRVEDAFAYAMNCHCSRCRAATGSAFKAFAGIEREKLEDIALKGRDFAGLLGEDSGEPLAVQVEDPQTGLAGQQIAKAIREYLVVGHGADRTPEPSALLSSASVGRPGSRDARGVHVHREGLCDLFGGYDACFAER